MQPVTNVPRVIRNPREQTVDWPRMRSKHQQALLFDIDRAGIPANHSVIQRTADLPFLRLEVQTNRQQVSADNHVNSNPYG